MSSVWIWRKSVQRFPRYFTQKSHRQLQKQNLTQVAVVWGRLSLLCVCHFVCTVTDFSAAEKYRGVKFCMHGWLLPAMSFCHFGELWVAESSGGITSGMYAAPNWTQATAPGKARWGFGIGCRGSVGHSELGAAVLLKAVWWDLHVGSLPTHLFFFCILCTVL